MTTETDQHVAGVQWAIRPLLDCAERQDDPERILAVAGVFTEAAHRLRAAARETAKANAKPKEDAA